MKNLSALQETLSQIMGLCVTRQFGITVRYRKKILNPEQTLSVMCFTLPMWSLYLK